MKRKVFFNPIIRYLILNSLKLNMTGLIALKAAGVGGISVADIISAAGILALINGAPLVFVCVLKKNKKRLGEDESRLSYGAVYNGKNVSDDNQHAWLYPMAFFWRRCGFIAATIFLFDYPLMQMNVHYVLTMISVAILAYNRKAFESRGQFLVEVGSEFLLHVTSILLS
mmetsp:Transcript_21882/g.29288  ORF Transcript_21882/g.29288 Transcript_21882/m.29288 type:complete len:170 (+) Transcript_21882:728-1237(+)|eukprot:CAMPEP_0185573938 /NCGR_PEP_ID=MMETSP0434-20130131/5513_1 /TAXON_ID=626734 ORGANISM="Favella taraikaensis, Strain Fe Narragansett Bay" /NCGR_SAMPLE_ID=MMETSP0434 /ASSEMBLY_ACC=CAM_ASM_000379 /LENGTH=169 /DNA_ID=CAMNT_0028190325 /DNA_START=718 /DNA_END=1227 /DNA_ORIENTATION=+